MSVLEGMVERVAMALAAHTEKGLPKFTQLDWEGLGLVARTAYRSRARTAMQAMKIEGEKDGILGAIAFEDGFLGEHKTISHAFVDGWNLTIDQALADAIDMGKP